MPTLATFDGVTISMYFKDHVPPHFHARFAEHEALVEIETLDVYAGSLPRPQLRLVLAWASENQNLLRARWAQINGG